MTVVVKLDKSRSRGIRKVHVYLRNASFDSQFHFDLRGIPVSISYSSSVPVTMMPSCRGKTARAMTRQTIHRCSSDAINRVGEPCVSLQKPFPTVSGTPKLTVSFFLTTLLLGDTDSPTATASCLGVLTTDTQAPVVSETTVSANLLEALEIVTELGVDTVGEDLGVLTVDNVALSVKEPCTPYKSVHANPFFHI